MEIIQRLIDDFAFLSGAIKSGPPDAFRHSSLQFSERLQSPQIDMKFLVLAAVLAIAAAAPSKREALDVKPVAIVKSASEFNDDGSYQFNFESEDGVKVEQAGSQKQIDPEDAESVGTVMRGSYSYVHEGVTYTVTWVADENGFQPSGAHLPVAPVA